MGDMWAKNIGRSADMVACKCDYTILCYTMLYCTILYHTIPYYTILYYTILCYAMLYYTILFESYAAMLSFWQKPSFWDMRSERC